MPENVRTALDRALEALDALQLLGEDVEDEWTYVTDLSDAWRSRIESVQAHRGDEPLDDERGIALDLAIEEAGRITDPHRAIDWLSTFPQVVLLTVGATP
jgi:hypothetical protein